MHSFKIVLLGIANSANISATDAQRRASIVSRSVAYLTLDVGCRRQRERVVCVCVC